MAFNARKSNKVFVETATLNLVDPETGVEMEEDGKPVSIEIYGKASKQHRKAVEVLNKRIEKRGNRKVSLDEMKKDSIDFLVAISVSTTNFVDDEDKPIETAEQFAELYSDDEISWIRDQVSNFASDDVNFLQK